MTTFDIVVRSIKLNGWGKVCIRVTNNRKIGYISTNLSVEKRNVINSKVTDTFVLSELHPTVKKYTERCARINTDNMTVSEIIELVTSSDLDVSFSEYCSKYIDDMMRKKRSEQAISNYKVAVNSISKFIGKENILFKDINRTVAEKYIESLSETRRAKNLYPVCISAIIESAIRNYNRPEEDVILIKYNPFKLVKIPSNTNPINKAIPIATLHEIFNADTSTSKSKITAERSRDVCILIFFLAGINVPDLYNAKKSDYDGETLRYNRTKTRKSRTDDAYFEVPIRPEIKHIIDKYQGNGDYLFNFRDEIKSGAKSFLKTIDTGLKFLCDELNINKVSSYDFRRTFATIAKRDCGFQDGDIAFVLNHVSAHRVTSRYIEKDFSIVGKVIDSVIEFTFK